MEFEKASILRTLGEGKWFIRNEVTLSPSELKLLHVLIKRKVLFFYELVSVVKQGVCARGRECYIEHTRNRKLMPLHMTLSPESIGYALHHAEIKPHEAVLMRYAHTDEQKELIEKGKNLVDDLIYGLIITPSRAKGTAHQSKPHHTCV